MIFKYKRYSRRYINSSHVRPEMCNAYVGTFTFTLRGWCAKNFLKLLLFSLLFLEVGDLCRWVGGRYKLKNIILINGTPILIYIPLRPKHISNTNLKCFLITFLCKQVESSPDTL